MARLIKFTNHQFEKEEFKEILLKLYVQENKTTYEIGEKFNVGSTAISAWLKKFGIPIKIRKNYENLYQIEKFDLTIEELEKKVRKWYLEEDLNAVEIAKKMNVNPRTVGRWFKKFGISVKGYRQVHLKNKKYLENENLEKDLRRLYLDEQKPMVEIGELYDVDFSVIGKDLRKFKIPIRNCSERGKIVWEDEGYIKRQKESHKKAWSLKLRKRQSSTHIKLWKDPKHRAKMKKAWGVTPNVFEWLVGSLPEMKNYEFTGDFAKRLGNYHPDFTWEEGKKIIETNGERWHDDPKREKRKIKIFESFGYDTLMIWWKEWKNDIESVKQKIKKFNEK